MNTYHFELDIVRKKLLTMVVKSFKATFEYTTLKSLNIKYFNYVPKIIKVHVFQLNEAKQQNTF